MEAGTEESSSSSSRLVTKTSLDTQQGRHFSDSARSYQTCLVFISAQAARPVFSKRYAGSIFKIKIVMNM